MAAAIEIAAAIFSSYPFTTVCFLMKAGSISMPDPGPVGTVTTPFSVCSEDVLHSYGTSAVSGWRRASRSWGWTPLPRASETIRDNYLLRRHDMIRPFRS